MTTGRPPRKGREANTVRGTLCLAALLFASALSGCSNVGNGLSYARLALPYSHTQLRSSTTLDVLNVARDPAYQFQPRQAEPVLLTQSDTAVAYSGRSADGRKTWLNLIAFDEFRMTAGRKYFFCLDERITTDPVLLRQSLFPWRKGLLLDGELLVDPEVLTTPYATDEAQKIAVLKWLAERFQNDVTALVGSPRSPVQGNEQITISAMAVNQLFQAILTELAQSPGLAKDLATGQGVSFPHPSLNEGRVRLLVENDTASVTVRINLPLPSLPKP
jgi:hypothetical protein